MILENTARRSKTGDVSGKRIYEINCQKALG